MCLLRHISDITAGSEDIEDNNVVLAVVLSTLACAVLVIISACYFRWRQSRGQMKINIEVTLSIGSLVLQ